MKTLPTSKLVAMVLQFMLKRPYTILCFNVHTAVEYLNRGTFLMVSYINTFKIFFGLCTAKAETANKNIQQRSLSGFITTAF